MRGEGNKFKSIWNSLNCNEMKQSRFKGILTGHFFAELAASPSATDLVMVFFCPPIAERARKGDGRSEWFLFTILQPPVYAVSSCFFVQLI